MSTETMSPQACSDPDGSTPPASPVILTDVGKRYGRRRGVQALHGVSVSFPLGSFTAVMGVSGSGKSTPLQCAAGLDQPSPGC
jgi:putative ABC transport system ATP-binding protein